MAIRSPQDFFYYDLCAMYDVERKLLQMLPQLAQECQNDQAREAFMQHEQETRQHVRNLEQCFQILGSQPQAMDNHTVNGLKHDHDSFLQQQPPNEALTLFDLYAGYQGEYIEIAAYHTLIDAANNLGLALCVQLFQENLLQEVEAAKKLSTIAHQYGMEQLHMGQTAVTDASLMGQPYGTSEAVTQGQQFVAPTNVGVNQPFDAGNLAEQQSTSFNPADTAAENTGQATKANSPTMENSRDVQSGMAVVGLDMGSVGRVREILENDFRVDIPMQRDLLIPFTAIQRVDRQAGQVVLNIPAGQVRDMNWAASPLI